MGDAGEEYLLPQITGMLTFIIYILDYSIAVALNCKFFEGKALCLSSQICTVKNSKKKEVTEEGMEGRGAALKKYISPGSTLW